MKNIFTFLRRKTTKKRDKKKHESRQNSVFENIEGESGVVSELVVNETPENHFEEEKEEESPQNGVVSRELGSCES